MSKTIVGLDIGTSVIRGVQITQNKDKITVNKVGQISIAPGLLENGAITNDSVPLIASALKELWKEAKFSTNTVYLGIGGESTLIRTGELEWAERDDLIKTLPYSSLVDEKVLADKSEYQYDYHTLGEYTKREKDPDDPDEMILVRKKMVILVGIKKKAIENITNAVLDAGLKPMVIDANAFAIIRAFNKETIHEEYASVDISVDIGADITTVAFHKSGQPLFIRITAPGGNIITSNIAKELGVNFERAEMRKFETFNAPEEHDETVASNFADLDEDEDPYSETILTEEEERARERVNKIRPIINQGNTAILKIIRESLSHFMSEEWGSDLPQTSGIYLSGGVSYTPALVSRIRSEFNIPVLHAEPFSPYLDGNPLEKVMGPHYGSEAKFVTALGISLAALAEGEN